MRIFLLTVGFVLVGTAGFTPRTAAMPLRVSTGDANAPDFDPGNPASNLVIPLSFQGVFNISDLTPVASPSTSNAYFNRYKSVSSVTLS